MCDTYSNLNIPLPSSTMTTFGNYKKNGNDKAREFKELGGYDIDGKWYPRVTKIVEIKSKPALYRFYAQVSTFDEGERIKEQSATEGTMVHEAAEAILTGKSPTIDPSIKPAIDAFVDFIEKNKIDVNSEFVEYRLVNRKDRYAGTLDALAHIGGKHGILDIKTSLSIYRDYNLQTSAYMAALIDQFPTLETRWILRIDQHQQCVRCGATMRSKGGRKSVKLPWQYQLKAIAEQCAHEWGDMQGLVEIKEWQNWENDYGAFLGAKRLWEWEHEDILKEIGYLS